MSMTSKLPGIIFFHMRKTFKYRAAISRKTEKNANNWLGLCCWLYNAVLEQRIMYYRNYKKTLNYYTQQNELPALKAEYPDFKQVGAQCLQDVVKRVDLAFQHFFRRVKTRDGRAGFPRFKSYRRYNSFTLTQSGWKLDGNHLHIRNVGRFKLYLSRPIEGDIKTVTIKRTSTGKWFVLFSCDNVPCQPLPESNKTIGLDVGLNSFCVDSTGKAIDNPKYFRRSEKLLRIRQRALARKKKGSIRRGKARLLVAKIHEKIHNQRHDFLHKLANYYIENFQIISVENLNVNGMVKNKHLSKSINDAGWSMFFDFLMYKAESAGRQVVKVSARNTSQACSGCGELVKKSLGVRVHECPECGLVIDRDLNAAININVAGQVMQAPT
jgi:putative transposase